MMRIAKMYKYSQMIYEEKIVNVVLILNRTVPASVK